MDVRFLFVVGYLLLMVGVSLYLKRKMVKSSDDFAVAGRRLPMIVLVGTLLATWCGGGGISGSAGLVYKNGPLFGILLFAGAPIGMIVLYFISGAVAKVPHILFRSCLSCATEQLPEIWLQSALFWRISEPQLPSLRQPAIFL